MARRLLTLLLLAVTATGCLLGPNYQRPPVVTPEHWLDTPTVDAASLANTPWWELFRDPQLQDLIRVALVENRDLRIAVERVVEARARYGYVRADLYPKVDLSAQGGVLELSHQGLNPVPESVDTESEYYDISAALSWEIDIFGRLRRASEAERARMIGAEETQRAAVLALVADVASTYVALRDADLQLEISRRTLASRRDYVDLAKTRFEGGITSEIDWRQAEAEYHRTAAIVQDLERSVRQLENLLSVLIGRNPGPIDRGVDVEGLAEPVAIPAGLPSELLDRRPDIRIAEQNLIAANANIGQAKALLFPRIALTGAFGFTSTELDTLFDSPAQSYSLLGGLLQPLFYAGQNRQRVAITESVMRQTLYGYEGTVLQAFREVEDSIIAYQKLGEQRVMQRARVEAERRVLELAELRYRGGVSDYLAVLDAQRSLFSSELDAVQVVGAHVTALIQLYKALGGGWPAEPAPAEDAATAEATATAP
jgi:outer membrane protein, multidrug efflux system